MEVFLYILLGITIVALVVLFVMVIRGGNKNKGIQGQLKQRTKKVKSEKTREEKHAEKMALKKAMKEQRQLWKEEDKKKDEAVKENIIAYKEDVKKNKVVLEEFSSKYEETKKERDQYTKEIELIKTQIKKLNEQKAKGENVGDEIDNLRSKLEIAKQNLEDYNETKFEEVEEKYLSYTKEYERSRQRLRIERDRISLIRKLDRWSKRGGRLRREIFIKRQYYYLVAPYTVLFTIFTVAPVLMSLYFSFTYFNLLEPPQWIGWENYMQLFVNDKVFITALRNTALLAVITGPVSYLMAFLFAWLINELKPMLRSFMTLIFYAPSISGNVYLVWKLIFSSDIYGYANSILLRFNIISEPILWLQNADYIIWILILVQLWLSLGVSFLAFIAGLQSVNRELYEAGAIDGIKNRWQELWHITLPQMKSQLMFGAVMQITSSLAVAEVSVQIAGFPSIEYAGHTIITHLMDYGNIRMEMGYASAIATILFLIMIVANILVRKILRRVGT